MNLRTDSGVISIEESSLLDPSAPKNRLMKFFIHSYGIVFWIRLLRQPINQELDTYEKIATAIGVISILASLIALCYLLFKASAARQVPFSAIKSIRVKRKVKYISIKLYSKKVKVYNLKSEEDVDALVERVHRFNPQLEINYSR